MYKLLLPAAILLFALTNLACMQMAPAGCEKIKNGRFYYLLKDSKVKVVVERNGSLQSERNTQSGHSSRSKIVWTGDCKFNKYINALSFSKLTGVDSIIASLPVSVEIIQVEKSFYVSHSTFGFLEQKNESIDTLYFDR